MVSTKSGVYEKMRSVCGLRSGQRTLPHAAVYQEWPFRAQNQHQVGFQSFFNFVVTLNLFQVH